MAKRTEPLPRPAKELEDLAAYYDTHDTSSAMEEGEWVDPRPMKTTSLRLPADVVEALKALAQTRGMRYTALVREIIEHALTGARWAKSDEFVMINERLARIEAAVVDQPESATEEGSGGASKQSPEEKARAYNAWLRKQWATVRAQHKRTAKVAGRSRRRVKGKR